MVWRQGRSCVGRATGRTAAEEPWKWSCLGWRQHVDCGDRTGGLGPPGSQGSPPAQVLQRQSPQSFQVASVVPSAQIPCSEVGVLGSQSQVMAQESDHSAAPSPAQQGGNA